MAKYRKKPIVIEAVKWDGSKEVWDTIAAWTDEKAWHTNGSAYGASIVIPTLEGEMRGAQGDYIIKGIQGEIYPCKPDIFHATYDEVTT